MAMILLVAASPAPQSRTEALLELARIELARWGPNVESIRLRDLPPQPLLHGEHRHPSLVKATEQLSRADGLVLAAPVYKGSLPGLLKCWLDVLPRLGMAEKHVLPLASSRWPNDICAFSAHLDRVLQSMAVGRIQTTVGISGQAGLDRSTQQRVATAVDDFAQMLPVTSHNTWLVS